MHHLRSAVLVLQHAVQVLLLLNLVLLISFYGCSSSNHFCLPKKSCEPPLLKRQKPSGHAAQIYTLFYNKTLCISSIF